MLNLEIKNKYEMFFNQSVFVTKNLFLNTKTPPIKNFIDFLSHRQMKIGELILG